METYFPGSCSLVWKPQGLCSLWEMSGQTLGERAQTQHRACAGMPGNVLLTLGLGHSRQRRNEASRQSMGRKLRQNWLWSYVWCLLGTLGKSPHLPVSLMFSSVAWDSTSDLTVWL